MTVVYKKYIYIKLRKCSVIFNFGDITELFSYQNFWYTEIFRGMCN